MPKTKKRKKAHSTRRRRMGAMKPAQSNALMMLAGAALGGAAGWYIYTTQKSIKDELMGFLQIGLGAAALLFTSIPVVQGVGLGLAATGAIIEGESFGILSGVTNLPSSSNLKIAGYGDVKQLGAVPGKSFPSPGAVGRAGMPMRYAGVYGR